MSYEETMPPNMELSGTKAEDIGVDGSIHRRVHDLMVHFGAKLMEVYHDNKGTSVSMVFDEDEHCILTVSLVNSLKEEATP